MSKTLITILGKGRDNPQTGYREASYCFDDGKTETTPFFGLALTRHLQVETVIILGTAGSMWGVLIEYLTVKDQEKNEDLRLELMDAESLGKVTQNLLDRITPLLQDFEAENVKLQLIPQGRSEEEQIGILEAIHQSLGKSKSEIHIDITHGFRHLAAIGFLSGALVERLRTKLEVKAIWYGALDMTRDAKTPVLCLCGLLAVQKWISAMDRFDVSGNYGVFAPLLVADGLPQDKSACLEKAAYFESITQIFNAALSLRTVLPDLESHLRGASALFQKQLIQRLAWAREEHLSEQQRLLALRALSRNDFLRAAILGLEALITMEVGKQGKDPKNFTDRKSISDILKNNRKEENDHQPKWLYLAFQELSSLRNSMAHGTPVSYKSMEKVIKDPQLLYKKLESTLGQLTTAHYS